MATSFDTKDPILYSFLFLLKCLKFATFNSCITFLLECGPRTNCVDFVLISVCRYCISYKIQNIFLIYSQNDERLHNFFFYIKFWFTGCPIILSRLVIMTSENRSGEGYGKKKVAKDTGWGWPALEEAAKVRVSRVVLHHSCWHQHSNLSYD